MEDAKAWLKSYGLNDTEITVYLCVFSRPEIKVSEIQRETGLIRTTIYNALSQLKTGGLVSENLQNNVKTYRAADIEALRHNIESGIAGQERMLEQLGQLGSFFETLSSDDMQHESFVARYEGVGPVKRAIEYAMRCDSKRWHVIASRDNFLHHCPKQYQQYYLQERKRRGITAKTLWEPTDEFTVHNLEEVFYRNPRKLPKEFRGTFKTLVIIYDNTTLIIDPYEQKTAHAIHNPTSTHFMRLLHEFAWNSSDKVS